MANILHKRKAADPSASDLTVGELAINTSDGGLFTKTSGGSVVEVGSGGGGGISNVVEDTTPQLGGNLDIQSNNITGTGTITTASVANNANGMRKITASTSSPSGGNDGDVWIKYNS